MSASEDTPDVGSTSRPGDARTSYDASPATKILFLTAEWISFVVFRLSFFFVIVSVVALPSALIQLLNLLSLPAAVVAGISRIIYWFNQIGAHRRRTQQAISIVRQLDAGEHPRYCLYLRPFLTNNSLRIPNSRFRRKSFPSMDKFFGRRIDLETVFAMSLERQAHPLIAIGETGFRAGAAKIVTDDARWRDVFAKLAKGASAIVIVPLPRPGTLWEVDHLVGDEVLLKKTLFVMPMRLRSGVQERLEPFWAEMREGLQRSGIRFPVFSGLGALFCMFEAGASFHQINSGGFDLDYLEGVISGVIHRQSIDTMFVALHEADQRAMLGLLKSFLYFSPATGQLASRAVPLHQITSKNNGLLRTLLDRGFVVAYRSSEGSEGQIETNLHPMLMDWPPLVAATREHEQPLRLKGALIESCNELRGWFVSRLNEMDESEVVVKADDCPPPYPASYLSGIRMLPDFEGELRPEEFAFAGRARRNAAINHGVTTQR